MKHQKIRLFCAILSAVLFVTGTAGCAAGEGAASGSSIPNTSELFDYTPKDGCFIGVNDKDDEYLWMYIEPDDLGQRTLWGVPTTEAEFISHDKAVKSIKDLKPGMMIRIVAPDYVDLLTYPKYFLNVASIETWGEYRQDLYKAGRSELDALGSEQS